MRRYLLVACTLGLCLVGAAWLIAAVPQAAPAAAATRFEYQVDQPDMLKMEDDDFEKLLNSKGSEGWRLIEMVRSPSADNNHYYLIYERPKKP